MHLLREPVTCVPCGHSFCLECMPVANAVEPAQMCCPVCNNCEVSCETCESSVSYQLCLMDIVAMLYGELIDSAKSSFRCAECQVHIQETGLCWGEWLSSCRSCSRSRKAWLSCIAMLRYRHLQHCSKWLHNGSGPVQRDQSVRSVNRVYVHCVIRNKDGKFLWNTAR